MTARRFLALILVALAVDVIIASFFAVFSLVPNWAKVNGIDVNTNNATFWGSFPTPFIIIGTALLLGVSAFALAPSDWKSK